MRFEQHEITMPNCDCDLVVKFPGGGCVTIQARPSNADVNYAGSLDFILPKNMPVINWIGDDMQAAPPSHRNVQHERIAKQLVMELPAMYAYEIRTEFSAVVVERQG